MDKIREALKEVETEIKVQKQSLQYIENDEDRKAREKYIEGLRDSVEIINGYLESFY